LPTDAPIQQDAISLSLVAAIGRRGELGLAGGLVFRIRTDMLHFRKVTAGKPVLMGRKTGESLPKRPLPGRPNIIATRNLEFLAPDAFVYSSLPPAIAAGRTMAAKMGVSEVCVIGGAEIYAAALPLADRLWLTDVDAETEADAFFPAFDRAEWRVISAQRVEADADNEFAHTIRELVRKA
jgi:dihydrofolate reductase